MILDERTEFCDATSAILAVGNAIIGDVIDLKPATTSPNTTVDLEGSDMYLVIQVDTTFVGATSTTKFELASDSTADLAPARRCTSRRRRSRWPRWWPATSCALSGCRRAATSATWASGRPSRGERHGRQDQRLPDVRPGAVPRLRRQRRLTAMDDAKTVDPITLVAVERGFAMGRMVEPGTVVPVPAGHRRRQAAQDAEVGGARPATRG
jgi:hypothetical protein